MPSLRLIGAVYAFQLLLSRLYSRRANPEVSSLADAIRAGSVTYQLFNPGMPEASRLASGVTVSSEKDVEDDTVRPALSTARTFTVCCPSTSPSVPEAGKVDQPPPSKLY